MIQYRGRTFKNREEFDLWYAGYCEQLCREGEERREEKRANERTYWGVVILMSLVAICGLAVVTTNIISPIWNWYLHLNFFWKVAVVAIIFGNIRILVNGWLKN